MQRYFHWRVIRIFRDDIDEREHPHREFFALFHRWADGVAVVIAEKDWSSSYGNTFDVYRADDVKTLSTGRRGVPRYTFVCQNGWNGMDWGCGKFKRPRALHKLAKDVMERNGAVVYCRDVLQDVPDVWSWVNGRVCATVQAVRAGVFEEAEVEEDEEQ